MKKKIVYLVLLIITFGMLGCSDDEQDSNPPAAAPKYVFYFIGDGMGDAHKRVTELFFDKTGKTRLKMNEFPVSGSNRTDSADQVTTDTAASGTALATGSKTNNGIISKTLDGIDLITLVEAAESNQLKTGIISTTRLTHATPAAFAAHNDDVTNENQIADDLVDSGVDFLAGGGFQHFVKADNELGLASQRDMTQEPELNADLIEAFKANDYKVFLSEGSVDDFLIHKPASSGEEKVLALFSESHLPYRIDQKPESIGQAPQIFLPSLSQMVEKGVDTLMTNNDSGFFMVVCGGRIDDASRNNDIGSVIHEVVDFDDAIIKAYEFYEQYPDETLIVVTSGHETGGLALGSNTDLDIFVEYGFYSIEYMAEDYTNTEYEDVAEFKTAMGIDRFRFNGAFDNLTSDEIIETIDTAITNQDFNIVGRMVSMYTGGADRNGKNIDWSSYGNTSMQVPLSAIGIGSENFSGTLDNDQVARGLADLLSFDLTPPSTTTDGETE